MMFMKDSFKIEDGKYGKRLVVTAAFKNSEIIKIIKEYGIKELFLYTKLGVGGDLSFLKKIPKLEAFLIMDFTIEDISPINTLHTLRSLGITTYCKTEIDFTQFPYLEECSLIWRPKAKSIVKCKTLRRLYVDKYTGKDTSPFSGLTNLESLSIGNSPIRSLEGLRDLKKLRFLGLYRLTKLESLSGIEGLKNLEELEIHTCKKIKSIKEVEGLVKLRKLYLLNCGEIDSIKPIEKLKELEEFLFYESTNIVDGDLTPLTKLPKLKKVSFQNRKHYSHKREDFNPEAKVSRGELDRLFEEMIKANRLE